MPFGFASEKAFSFAGILTPFRIVNNVEMTPVGVVFHALIGNFVRSSRDGN
jgi:hypothetical protein